MQNLPEIEGYWWVPGDEQQQVAGRVLVEGNTAKLVLTVDRSDQPLFDESRPQDYQVIHGLTFDSKQVTLIDCFDLSSARSSNGVEQRIVLANFVLIGCLIPPVELDKAFGKLVLKWPLLKRWFWKSGIEVTRDKQDFSAFSISYKPIEPISFQYSDGLRIDFRFTTDTIPLGSLLADEISFQEVVWVELESDQPQSLRYFLRIAEELEHFFSLCMLEHVAPEEISLLTSFDVIETGADEPVSHQATVYRSRQYSSRTDRAPHPVDFLIGYSHVADKLHEILPRWHLVAEQVSPAMSLYFLSLYGQKQFIETEFLLVVQAAEVLHRKLHGGTYLPPDEYERDVRPLLEQSIPEKVDKEIADVLSSRLEYLNELSLARRLKEMARSHLRPVEHYSPKWKHAVRQIANARNHFTHYSGGEDTAPSIEDLVEYEELIQLLIELEALSACGVDKSILGERALEAQHYRQSFPIRGKPSP